MNPTKLTFKETGEFRALWAAQTWCEQNDFSYGPVCRDNPITIAIMRGDVSVPKWGDITTKARLCIDGQMTSDDCREGPVTVEIF